MSNALSELKGVLKKMNMIISPWGFLGLKIDTHSVDVRMVATHFVCIMSVQSLLD